MKINQEKIFQRQMDSREILKIYSPKVLETFPNQIGWTNDVLMCEKKNETQIFLPCYLRTKLKNLIQLDCETGKGSINIVIILSIYYGQVEKLIPKFLQKISGAIILRFKVDPAMLIQEGFSNFEDDQGNQRSNYVTFKLDEKKKLITYSIRRTLIVPLISHIFWSPFEVIKFISTISIDSVEIDDQNRDYKVSFNLMNLHQDFDQFTVVSYTQEGALGQYNLARSLIQSQFSNSRIYSKGIQVRQQKKHKRKNKKIQIGDNVTNSDQGQYLKTRKVKIQAFKYSHCVYPVYRHPTVPYISLFLPMVLLGFLNLGVFFQDNKQSIKKVANIAAILVSYIAFLPVIRAKLPPSNSLVISEILLFSMASLTILCLAHTIKVKNINEYEFIWYEDGIFLASFVITIFLVAIWFVIWVVFYCFFYRTYNKESKQKERKFNRDQWLNKECDQYFDSLNQQGLKIQTISQYYLGLVEEKQKLRNQAHSNSNILPPIKIKTKKVIQDQI